jgi:hypothetical protein
VSVSLGGSDTDDTLAGAHFTDHVAVLTGRFAAEHLRDLERPLEALTDSPVSS